jgi:hypothetical protein
MAEQVQVEEGSLFRDPVVAEVLVGEYIAG